MSVPEGATHIGYNGTYFKIKTNDSHFVWSALKSSWDYNMWPIDKYYKGHYIQISEEEQMNDLEWLARNVHEWNGDNECKFMFKETHGCDYAEENTVGTFTRAQWQDERDRISGKPTKWMFHRSKSMIQLPSGRWYEFNGIVDVSMLTSDYADTYGEYVGKGEVLGDWTKTLEQRPVEAPTESCDDTRNDEENDMEQNYVQQAGRSERKATLCPGDYCDVRDTTPELRKAVTFAFLDAGCKTSIDCQDEYYPYIGWVRVDDNVYGYSTKSVFCNGDRRLLTVDQVLNATNAGGDTVGEFEFNTQSAYGTKEWGAAGLPPVGSAVEYASDPNSIPIIWDECIYLARANNEDFVLISSSDSVDRMKAIDPSRRFRPIRTEEERAVEEMLNCLEGVDSATCNAGAIGALYRAGYRKTEQ